MKKTILFALRAFAALTIGCADKCEAEAACQDEVPFTELCTAAFTRWFYDSNTKSCVERSYSGCKEYGFASSTECLECQCNNN